MPSIILAKGDFELELNPALGGSIHRAAWRGEDILAARSSATILDTACFPLVPFSNRIAGSRFDFAGETIALEPNHPSAAENPVLHGFGWLGQWHIEQADARSTALGFRHDGGEWPWPFTARQFVEVLDNGFVCALTIANESDKAMPAGLGFHPYFPRTGATLLRSQHLGEWQNDATCLPQSLLEHDEPIDWWHGKPVANRLVDTVYTGRSGPLVIEWPERRLAARISPSADLPFTTIYVPRDETFFCVEPVSHMTDAFNRSGAESGARVLGPGESWTVTMRIEAYSL